MPVKRQTIAVCLLACGCQRGPSQDDVSRMVDQRLSERGIAPPSSASGSGALMSYAPPPTDPVAASLAFLDRLETLMRDYKPEVMPVEDSTDALRCVTTEAFETDPQLKAARSKLVQRLEVAARNRVEREREFWSTVYPVAFRIDYDWETRRTQEVPAEYACFNTVVPNSGGYGPGGNGFYPGWAPRLKTKEECQGYGGGDFQWRVRVPARPAVFVYSSTMTPPASPPELMRRLAAEGVQVPDRFWCRVADVSLAGGRAMIKCEPRGAGPYLRLSGDSQRRNVGDVVSVPLAGTKHDPDGVLLRVPRIREASAAAVASSGARRARGVVADLETNGSKGQFSWVVDADWATLRVVSQASCPGIEEVLSSIAGGKP